MPTPDAIQHTPTRTQLCLRAMSLLVVHLALPSLQGSISRVGSRGNSICMAAPDGFVPPPPKEGDYVDIFCRAVSKKAWVEL